MKLEQQVCSLDLARKLKELGVKQESYFYWAKGKYNKEFTLVQYKPEIYNQKGLSAFTVAELGILLPEGSFTMWQSPEWICQFKNDTTEGPTEADARGAMMVYLLEQKLI